MTQQPTLRFDDVDEQMVNQLLPDYAPVSFVNRGGQKRVFKCEYQGAIWALKLHLVSEDLGNTVHPATTVVNGDDSETEPVLDQVTARARREVSALASCDTPHLPKIEPGGLQTLQYCNLSMLFYLEEFLDGESVQALMRYGPLSEDDLRRLGVQVASAIDALWNCGGGKHQLVHRDIKPANIMMRGDGSFVLIDMGLAFDLLDVSLTDAGAIPGTKPYLTPDQLDYSNKRSMDFRTDMFSLGVVMYEAATQVHPFLRGGMSSAQLFTAIVRSKPEPITRHRSDLSAELVNVIDRLLAKRPHLRFRKCADLIKALETQ